MYARTLVYIYVTEKKKKTVVRLMPHIAETGSTSNQARCPAGTYNNVTGLTQVSDCTPCLQGWFCDVDGLEVPTDLCSEGKHCRSTFVHFCVACA